MSQILCNYVLVTFHVANIGWIVTAINDNGNDIFYLRQFITIFKTIPVEKINDKELCDCDKKDIMIVLMSDVLLGNEWQWVLSQLR